MVRVEAVGPVRGHGASLVEPEAGVVPRIDAVAFIADGGTLGSVNDVLEVGPDALGPEVLDAVVRALDGSGAGTSRLVGPDGETIELPERIQSLLVSIVENLRAGNGVSVIPLHAELTTVQAAELLNMSRPHLIKQIEAGEIPHHMVGTHRRLKLVDVLAYRDRLEAQANEALDAMTAEAEDLGLYQ